MALRLSTNFILIVNLNSLNNVLNFLYILFQLRQYCSKDIELKRFLLENPLKNALNHKKLSNPLILDFTKILTEHAYDKTIDVLYSINLTIKLIQRTKMLRRKIRLFSANPILILYLCYTLYLYKSSFRKFLDSNSRSGRKRDIKK